MTFKRTAVLFTILAALATGCGGLSDDAQSAADDLAKSTKLSQKEAECVMGDLDDEFGDSKELDLKDFKDSDLGKMNEIFKDCTGKGFVEAISGSNPGGN